MSKLTSEEMYNSICKVCHEQFTTGCDAYGVRCPLFDEYPCITRNPDAVKEHYDILVKAGFINEDTEHTPETKPNNVDHPTHYNSGKIECIDAMESAFGKEAVKHFCICNAFKYTWRADKKNGVEDIDKAIWYLNKYKELSDVLK